MARRGATADPTATELVEIRERDRKAVELATAGASYEQIAQTLGYSDRSGAWKAVQRALMRHEASDVDALRAVESARLDRIQAANWTAAMKGDAAAARVCLSAIDRRIRLYGLDAPTVVHGRLEIDMTDPDARVRELQEIQQNVQALLAAVPADVDGDTVDAEVLDDDDGSSRQG